ncbi:hypothetical protein [Alloprevotella sp. OH1205_COT-284]|uniref:hypothetical protein n=1 Tax=Alloprevotella sp. OH1205_COT-284 TaxID=2491043 RepID=UPI0011D033B7|nr:hypothetical protein [Alloprevotella sp. OH1205_COT-284]
MTRLSAVGVSCPTGRLLLSLNLSWRISLDDAFFVFSVRHACTTCTMRPGIFGKNMAGFP